VKIGGLPEGMDSGIGAAGDQKVHRMAAEKFQPLLQGTLHGRIMGLLLPA
jgi:hypothetical protein